MSKILTPQMIIKRSRGCYDISMVRKLNFWGASLEDISIIRECRYLESATFSQNYISSLECFQNLNNLHELSLAKNQIRDIRQINYLSTCNNLRKLWLKDNPITNMHDYRLQIIRILPNLQFLDDVAITNEEREMANTGHFVQQDFQQQENIYHRPPSYDPYNNKNNDDRYEKKNYGYFRHESDVQKNYKNNNINYIGILPGMVDENEKYLNKYDRYRYNKKPETPSRIYERYGSSKRGMTPLNMNNNSNNYGFYDNYQDKNYQNQNYYEKNYNNNDNNAQNFYQKYERNIPNSAQSHVRKYGNNNPMEVSSTGGQQGIIDCVSTLLRGLSTDELMYIKEHIDRKIEKY